MLSIFAPNAVSYFSIILLTIFAFIIRKYIETFNAIQLHSDSFYSRSWHRRYTRWSQYLGFISLPNSITVLSTFSGLKKKYSWQRLTKKKLLKCAIKSNWSNSEWAKREKKWLNGILGLFVIINGLDAELWLCDAYSGTAVDAIEADIPTKLLTPVEDIHVLVESNNCCTTNTSFP